MVCNINSKIKVLNKNKMKWKKINTEIIWMELQMRWCKAIRKIHSCTHHILSSYKQFTIKNNRWWNNALIIINSKHNIINKDTLTCMDKKNIYIHT